MRTLASVAEQVRSGRVTAREMLDASLVRIDDPAGEGRAAFRVVSRESAQATAAAVDELRAAGVPLPPLAGVPISIKDLFDVAGEQTLAGSRVLKRIEPAHRDAPVIQRLRAAGAVFIGRTNMTEFAYSGLGINPHYGTPANPFDRSGRRLPGGSSSGAVISVTDGMAYAGIGSDTGGSCRIPAALCGVTGFKPTQHRIPLEGVDPLSPSYDTVGAMAPTVACCALLDAIMAGESAPVLAEYPLNRQHLLVIENVLMDDLDAPTSAAFDSALRKLSEAGALISRERLDALALLPELVVNGGIVAAEAYARHRRLIEEHRGEYDPRVVGRIELGARQTAADYIDLHRLRRTLIETVVRETASFDAIIAPTTPITAPPIASLEDESEYMRVNRLMLRNPSLANLLDWPSVSLPCHRPGAIPVGLMLIGNANQDRRLFEIANTIERIISHE